MISKTVFSISTEESRFTLNGALLILRKGGLVMVATDGHRLAMVESSSDVPGITGAYRALLPRKGDAAELQKLAGDSEPDALVKFSGDENHLFFQLGDRLLLSRKLTGNFPDFERVLPKEHTNSVTLGREEFRAAIRTFVAQFSDERVVRHSRACRRGRREKSIRRFRKPERAKRVFRRSTPAPRSRLDSMRSIFWSFCARFPKSRFHFCSRIRIALGSYAPGGEKIWRNTVTSSCR